mmetsp:Transcript_63990/g.149053  ORF Transcript_63990/g.149053 Transcript_63990/m.149053 type:complete len:184 (-) Transcript_63990:151-702(-)
MHSLLAMSALTAGEERAAADFLEAPSSAINSAGLCGTVCSQLASQAQPASAACPHGSALRAARRLRPEGAKQCLPRRVPDSAHLIFLAKPHNVHGVKEHERLLALARESIELAERAKAVAGARAKDADSGGGTRVRRHLWRHPALSDLSTSWHRGQRTRSAAAADAQFACNERIDSRGGTCGR